MLIEYTHFTTDIQRPDIAIVFSAYQCDYCHKMHRKTHSHVGVMPWIKAILAKLHKLDKTPALEGKDCPKLNPN